MPIFSSLSSSTFIYAGGIKIEAPDFNRNYLFTASKLDDLIVLDVLHKASEKLDIYSDLREIAPRMEYNPKVYFKFRFVVTRRQKVYFALEGYPDGIVPAHYQMISESKEDADCLSAGNIIIENIINTDGLPQPKIIWINHKSGDFRPTYNSLAVALKLLLSSHRSLFNDNLYIQELNRKGAPIEGKAILHNVDSVTSELSGFTLPQSQSPLVASVALAAPRSPIRYRPALELYTPTDGTVGAAVGRQSAEAFIANTDEESSRTYLSPAKRVRIDGGYEQRVCSSPDSKRTLNRSISFGHR